MNKRVLFVSRQATHAIHWQPRDGVHVKISGHGPTDLRVELLDEPVDSPVGVPARRKPSLPHARRASLRRA